MRGRECATSCRIWYQYTTHDDLHPRVSESTEEERDWDPTVTFVGVQSRFPCSSCLLAILSQLSRIADGIFGRLVVDRDLFSRLIDDEVSRG